MLSPAAARDTLAALIERASAKGADAADAVYVGDRSTSVTVRMGALEDVSRAEGEEIGLRLFRGSRSAAVASSDLSADAITALVDRAFAMAGEAPDDRYAGLAPDELLFRGSPADLEQWIELNIRRDQAASRRRSFSKRALFSAFCTLRDG